jgi:hypothetical protein
MYGLVRFGLTKVCNIPGDKFGLGVKKYRAKKSSRNTKRIRFIYWKKLE